MTGYARAEGAHGGRTWFWELRSVNGRALDVRVRLPQGLEDFDRLVRPVLAAKLVRGNVSVTLNMTEPSAPLPALNKPFLDALVQVGREYAAQSGLAPPTLDTLIAVRGVVDVATAVETAETRTAREHQLKATLTAAVEALVSARQDEGARLAAILADHLDEIERLIAAARTAAAAEPARLKARLLELVRELVTAEPRLSDERLNQEVALLLVKGDIREEIDRLTAHVAQARDLLAAGGAVGRRLDFLTQEFNREANTLCSKSADIALTRIGLDLKATIDRIREQVQNVE
ncbi:MAG: YicC family protein [Alphaproteobacteria bacterium]|nr:YicC family protein [Alphaproteobacteria bacterium]